MSKASSFLLPLHTTAPDFALPDVVTGKIVTLNDLKGKKGVLVMFICRHCPYVQHVIAQISSISQDYADKDLTIIGISANDPVSYPDDDPEHLKEMVQEKQLLFPLLYDQTQEVAQAYHAMCTPDFYLFNHSLQLMYHGQLDDSRPDNTIPVTGRDLRTAIECVLLDREVTSHQKPSMGCSIKWKPGREPAYVNALS